MFSRAIVRAPSENFADGLTSVDLGVPDLEKALVQHRAYCEALVRCGLELIELEPDARYPDSTFVEDTAILTENLAVIMQPGAARSSVLQKLLPSITTGSTRCSRRERSMAATSAESKTTS